MPTSATEVANEHSQQPCVIGFGDHRRFFCDRIIDRRGNGRSFLDLEIVACSDAVVVVGGEDEKSSHRQLCTHIVAVHASVLASFSSVLRAAMSDAMVSSVDGVFDTRSLTIVVPDCDQRTLSNLISFLYRGVAHWRETDQCESFKRLLATMGVDCERLTVDIATTDDDETFALTDAAAVDDDSEPLSFLRSRSISSIGGHRSASGKSDAQLRRNGRESEGGLDDDDAAVQRVMSDEQLFHGAEVDAVTDYLCVEMPDADCKDELDLSPEVADLPAISDDIGDHKVNGSDHGEKVKDLRNVVTIKTEHESAGVSRTANALKQTKRRRMKLKQRKRLLSAMRMKRSAIKCSPVNNDTMHTDEKPLRSYTCTMCAVSFNRKKFLTVHYRSQHVGEKPYKCTFCSFATTHDSKLKRHQLVHTKEKPYSCPQCEYVGITKEVVDSHMFVHTGEKPFICESCPYRTTRKGSLRIHVLAAHMKNKPFKCDQCSFSTIQKSVLQSHKLLHTGEKPFLCEMCMYTCRNKAYLEKHMRMKHKEQRPYQCDSCPYSALYPKELTHHIEIVHQKVKLHKCPFCDISYGRRQSLRYHIRTHTGEKPYRCDYCSFSAVFNCSVKKHIRRVHMPKGAVEPVVDLQTQIAVK